MNLQRGTLLVLSAVFVASAFTRPHIDGDLYWQQWLGERIVQTHALPRHLGADTFAASGAPWTPQEWLFGVVAAVLAALHAPALLWIALAAATVATLFFVDRTIARLNAAPLAHAVTLTLCVLAFLPSFGVRAQVLGWCCFAALLWSLDAVALRAARAFAVTVVWANLHASVMLAPTVAALDALVVLLTRRRFDRDLWQRAGLVPLLALATCISPLGIDLPRYALSVLGSPIRTQITEWHPLHFTDGSWYLVVAMLVAGALAWRFWAARPREVARTVLLGAASFYAIRNVPLFAIAAAPLVALGITTVERRFSGFARFSERFSPGRVAALAPVCALVAAVSTYLVMRAPAWVPPEREIAALAARHGEHHLFCEDFSWCSVALAYPNLSVFLDGRADPFPSSVWRSAAAIRRGGNDLNERLRRLGVDAVITSPEGPLDRALRADRRWNSVVTDSRFHLYVRARDARYTRTVRR